MARALLPHIQSPRGLPGMPSEREFILSIIASGRAKYGSAMNRLEVTVSAVSVLAQANQIPRLALSLIGGRVNSSPVE